MFLLVMEKHMAKREQAEEAIDLISAAVKVRSEITEHYNQYKGLTAIAVFASGVSHHDIKKAVDALYYLGGGWPSANSKGRMEALLDGFAGMYRVLDFIGNGHLVEDHLKPYGISVSLLAEKAIPNKTFGANELKFLDAEYSSEYFNLTDITDTRSLVSAIVEECQALQGLICKKADSIKLDLRPNAKDVLGIEDVEYDRLVDFVKLQNKDDDRSKEKAVNKRTQISSSISSFNMGLMTIGKK